MWMQVINGVVLLLAVAFYLLKNHTRKLSGKYEKFRQEFQLKHDEIDDSFHHHDLLVNHTNWHYVDEGIRDGPVVLFVHGFPESWYVWRYILPLLDQTRYRLIAIDLKGFGRSVSTNTDYNWHSIGDQINEFMQVLQIHQYYVVSHDWGTLVSSVLVHDHPQQILGYIRMQVELNLNHRYDDYSFIIPPKVAQFLARPQFVLFQLQWLMEIIMADRRKFLLNTYQKRMVKKFEPIDLEYLTYEYSRKDLIPAIFPYVYYRNWDFRTALDGICFHNFTFPVLQLQANQDHTQPNSLFENVQKDCPNVQLKWIENAGHFDMFDEPAAIATAISEFLSSHSSV